MSNFQIKRFTNIPSLLKEIPKPPPKLYYRGEIPEFHKYKVINIVGSRMPSPYGREVCRTIIHELAGYPVIIVSGLALGIDSIALETALLNSLPCVAFPGSGLSDKVIYPQSKYSLAMDILRAGGALISEYEENMRSQPWMFPQRNRLMVGLSDVTVIIEAREKSGSLITAKYAVEYNRDLMVVPGSIFSELSRGTHQFLKLGAYPLTCTNDLLELLGFDKLENKRIKDLNINELTVLNKINGSINKDELFDSLEIPITDAGSIIMSLIMKGIITEVGNEFIVK